MLSSFTSFDSFSELELELIRNSFVNLIPDSDNVSRKFYSILFERAPEVRTLFPTSIQTQADKFVMMIAAMIDAVDKPTEFNALCQEQKRVHAHLHLTPEHFELVKDSFVAAMKASNRFELHPDEATLWERLFDQIAFGMLAGSTDQ